MSGRAWKDIATPAWASRCTLREERTGWLQLCLTVDRRDACIDREWRPSRRYMAEWVHNATKYTTNTPTAVATTLQVEITDISHEAPNGSSCWLIQIARE